jgi:hypothetical protein
MKANSCCITGTRDRVGPCDSVDCGTDGCGGHRESGAPRHVAAARDLPQSRMIGRPVRVGLSEAPDGQLGSAGRGMAALRVIEPGSTGLVGVGPAPMTPVTWEPDLQGPASAELTGPALVGQEHPEWALARSMAAHPAGRGRRALGAGHAWGGMEAADAAGRLASNTARRLAVVEPDSPVPAVVQAGEPESGNREPGEPSGPGAQLWFRGCTRSRPRPHLGGRDRGGSAADVPGLGSRRPSRQPFTHGPDADVTGDRIHEGLAEPVGAGAPGPDRDEPRDQAPRGARGGDVGSVRGAACEGRWVRVRPRAAHRTRDSGMVTAETAVAIPVLALVAVAMSWVMALAVGQGQLLAAAREGARAAARGDSAASVVASATRVAPNASVRVSRTGSRVRVVATQHRQPPGPLSGLGRRLRAEAVAAVEP